MLFKTTSLYSRDWSEFIQERWCPEKYESTATESSFSFECNGEFAEDVDEEEIGVRFDLTGNHFIELSW